MSKYAPAIFSLALFALGTVAVSYEHYLSGGVIVVMGFFAGFAALEKMAEK